MLQSPPNTLCVGLIITFIFFTYILYIITSPTSFTKFHLFLSFVYRQNILSHTHTHEEHRHFVCIIQLFIIFIRYLYYTHTFVYRGAQFEYELNNLFLMIPAQKPEHTAKKNRTRKKFIWLAYLSNNVCTTKSVSYVYIHGKAIRSTI